MFRYDQLFNGTKNVLMMSINKFEDHEINRGIELMLRRGKIENQPKSNEKKIIFLKIISFFKREFSIKIEFIVKKKK